MDTLFLGLKKLLVSTIFVVFAFVMLYVPQAPSSHVVEVEAAGFGSIVYDPSNTAQNSLSTVQETITAAAAQSDWTKNLSLDGIAWSLAKRTISGMVASLIDWVNSGFQGKPAFITDLRGFLLNIADETVGEAISELGKIGSFICSPFRLDVQVSIAVQYAQSRNQGQDAPACTLTGIIDNIEGFISGVDPGRGLADWFTITSSPMTYTPYGSVLTAESYVRARLINAQGEELKILDYGSGFLSQEVCETVSGGGESCSIVTPGKVVQEALSFNLDSGRQSLVEADEINELVGALLGQLANQAITGVAGLLGLSGGGGYSYSDDGVSYLDALLDEGNNLTSTSTAATTLTEALRTERAYRGENQFLLDKLEVFIIDTTNPAGQRNIATILNEEISNEVARSDANIIALTGYLAEYDLATVDRQVEIFIEYTNLDITNQVRKAQNLADWKEQMTLIGIDPTDYRGLDAILGTSSTTTATSTDGDNE